MPRTASGKVDLVTTRNALLNSIPDQTPARHGFLEQVLEAAGRVFDVSPDANSSESTPENTPGWNSFWQIALALAVEEAFDLPRPLFRAGIAQFGDSDGSVRNCLSARQAVASHTFIGSEPEHPPQYTTPSEPMWPTTRTCRASGEDN